MTNLTVFWYCHIALSTLSPSLRSNISYLLYVLKPHSSFSGENLLSYTESRQKPPQPPPMSANWPTCLSRSYFTEDALPPNPILYLCWELHLFPETHVIGHFLSYLLQVLLLYSIFSTQQPDLPSFSHSLNDIWISKANIIYLKVGEEGTNMGYQFFISKCKQ